MYICVNLCWQILNLTVSLLDAVYYYDVIPEFVET